MIVISLLYYSHHLSPFVEEMAGKDMEIIGAGRLRIFEVAGGGEGEAETFC